MNLVFKSVIIEVKNFISSLGVSSAQNDHSPGNEFHLVVFFCCPPVIIH
ncbi:MAG: hypothetical protein IPP08_09285 [Chlorobiota bacterium]|nr:MAG: hypothetical protein IPP08_09285 [Chlorobiota bacterium]